MTRWGQLAWLLLLASASVALSAEGPPVPVPASAEELDRGIQFLPPDTIAATLAFPRQILASSLRRRLPTEVTLAEFTRQTGIPLAQVEWLLAFWDRPNDDVLSQGVILRFAEVFDWRRLEGPILRETQLELLQDHPYRRGSGPLGISLYALDEQTLILARDATLRRMVLRDEAGRHDSPIVRLLINRRSQRLDLHAIVLLERLRDLIPGVTLAGIPQQSADTLQQFADQVRAMEFRSRVQNELIVGWNMYCRDADAATAAQAIWDRSARATPTPDTEHAEAAIQDPLPGITYLWNGFRNGLLGRRLQQRDAELQLGFRGSEEAHLTTIGAFAIMAPTVGREVRTLTADLQRWNAGQQLARAMLDYLHEHEQLPVPGNTIREGRALLSWRVHLLPYLGQQALHDQFHLDEPWDSPHNHELIRQMPAVFQDPTGAVEYRTRFLIPNGPGTWFANFQNGTRNEMAAEASQDEGLMLVMVDPSQAVVWTQPTDLELDVWSPEKSLDAMAPGGFLGVRSDGTAHFFVAPWTSDQLRVLFLPAPAQ